GLISNYEINNLLILTALIFVSALFVASTSCFIITNEDPALPTQELYGHFILRTLPNKETKLINCPRGTYLDITTLTCQFKDPDSIDPIANDDNDDEPWISPDAYENPDNCRSFILSGNGGDFIVDCPTNLLFNKASGYCDWPGLLGAVNILRGIQAE
ncbi:hypothetical protein NQ317_011485, partial [Molorchus minor]